MVFISKWANTACSAPIVMYFMNDRPRVWLVFVVGLSSFTHYLVNWLINVTFYTHSFMVSVCNNQRPTPFFHQVLRSCSVGSIYCQLQPIFAIFLTKLTHCCIISVSPNSRFIVQWDSTVMLCLPVCDAYSSVLVSWTPPWTEFARFCLIYMHCVT